MDDDEELEETPTEDAEDVESEEAEPEEIEGSEESADDNNPEEPDSSHRGNNSRPINQQQKPKNNEENPSQPEENTSSKQNPNQSPSQQNNNPQAKSTSSSPASKTPTNNTGVSPQNSKSNPNNHNAKRNNNPKASQTKAANNKHKRTPQAHHSSSSKSYSGDNATSNENNSNSTLQDLMSGGKTKGKITKVIKNIKIIIPVVLVALAAIALSAGLILLASIFGDSSKYDEFTKYKKRTDNTRTIGNYFKPSCTNPTIYFVDDNDEAIDTATINIEDYIAGVVYDEIGNLNDPELYKAYAIILRNNLNTTNEECTIKSKNNSENVLNITSNNSDIANEVKSAVNEVKGKVIAKNKSVIKTTYDYFCANTIDENYYVLQHNQRVSKTWADNLNILTNEDKSATCTSNNDFSIVGAHYLSKENDFNYQQILDYYYGEGYQLTSDFYSSIGNLEIKVTKDAKGINKNIDEFLKEHGSSVEEMNQYIYENVMAVGPGTREAVIVSALSMVNFLYDNFDAKIPYCNSRNDNYWLNYGISPYFGNPMSDHNAGEYCPYGVKGIDCTAFVSMVLKNAGVDNTKLPSGRISLYTSDHTKYDDKCDTKSTNCIGKPGDILLSDVHGALIIDVDEDSGVYFVAESGNGGDGVIIQTWKIHNRFYSYPNTPIYVLNMDKYYGKEEYTISNYAEAANPYKE